jgi:p38 MAP kinase
MYTRIHTISSSDDKLGTQRVAIKKILKPFGSPVLAKRTYRELKLLKQLKHDNVLPLSLITRWVDYCAQGRLHLAVGGHLLCDGAARYRPTPVVGVQTTGDAVCPVLFVSDIGMSTTVKANRVQRGLKYIHSAGVIHRDLVVLSLVIDGGRNQAISSSMKIATSRFATLDSRVSRIHK